VRSETSWGRQNNALHTRVQLPNKRQQKRTFRKYISAKEFGAKFGIRAKSSQLGDASTD
jgi:hypothetical protein